MDEDINKLILQLQLQLNKKYGRHFKKFYLSKHIDSEKWEGLISSKDEEGGRNAEYYTINENRIVKDDKITY
jgi:hypothetical protein